jgi:ornithine cyclodeaminase/alanine dehydrogenase-like protein (mu-crystallin family)
VEHREQFERRLSGVVAAVTDGVDIVLCATSANSPVFEGSLFKPGQHVSTIVGADVELVEAGQTPELGREIHNETIRRTDIYAANLVAQGKQNRQRDLQVPVQEGVIKLDDVFDLPDIIGRDHAGRKNEHLTLSNRIPSKE